MLPLYFTDSTVPVSAADALVSAIAPTEKTVIAESTPAMIFLKMLVFFIDFQQFICRTGAVAVFLRFVHVMIVHMLAQPRFRRFGTLRHNNGLLKTKSVIVRYFLPPCSALAYNACFISFIMQQKMTDKLSTKELLALKAQAHHLNPVVMIGQHGLTESVIKETDAALTAHELIKVRVLGDDREERVQMCAALCANRP